VFARLFNPLFPALAAVALFGTSLLSDADKPAFTKQQKAFYADPNLVDFVRPGLVVTINSASIASDGTITVQFTIADPKGLPLDRAGITTPGAVATSFVAAQIPPDQDYYVSYVTTTAQGPFGPAVQPAADSGGTYTQTGPGQYTYTFRTKATGEVPATTQAVGVYATRDLTEFDLGSFFSNDVFHFVPAGGPLPKTHEVIDTATCNKCHDPLEAHGGARQIVPLCVLCHTMPAIDPDTGNSIQFQQMIHKIHEGSELPSVQAGTPYQIIGFRGAVNDWSDVVFPAAQEGEGARPCEFCHEGTPFPGGTPPGSVTPNQTNPPPDNKWWLTKPSIEACGSCHDNVNFTTGVNHPAGPQPNGSCANCHIPQGVESLGGASIYSAHVIPRYVDGYAPLHFTIQGITNNMAGQNPTVTFTITDSTGTPVAPSSMNLLNLVIAGPTPAYQSFLNSESAISGSVSAGSGAYSYTFKKPIPSDATGTYTAGIEGYKNVIVGAGTPNQQTVREPGMNQVMDFPVSGTGLNPGPVIVADANCNSCHYFLSAHGTIRNNPQYCPLCHNPTATDVSQRPADQLPAQSIYLPFLIHRLHAAGGIDSDEPGEAGPNPQPFIVYGFNHSLNNFSTVRFPGNLADCAKCHVNNSQQLPVPAGTPSVTDPRGFINPVGPATIACLACHNSQAAASHALLNGGDNTRLGEACVVCHGPDAQFSVDRMHAM
jgi:OmcA/MtrC family decaheme c-type cytochrome